MSIQRILICGRRGHVADVLVEVVNGALISIEANIHQAYSPKEVEKKIGECSYQLAIIINDRKFSKELFALTGKIKKNNPDIRVMLLAGYQGEPLDISVKKKLAQAGVLEIFPKTAFGVLDLGDDLQRYYLSAS